MYWNNYKFNFILGYFFSMHKRRQLEVGVTPHYNSGFGSCKAVWTASSIENALKDFYMFYFCFICKKRKKKKLPKIVPTRPDPTCFLPIPISIPKFFNPRVPIPKPIPIFLIREYRYRNRYRIFLSRLYRYRYRYRLKL